MLDHGLQTQVAAALRHAIALTGPEQYHRDCALILEVVRSTFEMGLEGMLTDLACTAAGIGFADERVGDQGDDERMMMALEAVFDILAGHRRLSELLAGVFGMVRWIHLCLVEGDRARLRQLAAMIETVTLKTTHTRSAQELH